MVRIFVLDPHQLTRVGLVAVLSEVEDLQICGFAESPSLAFTEVLELKPDLILVDLPLLGAEAHSFVAQIKRQMPESKLIVFTASTDDDSLSEVLAAGAHAYVFKGTSVDMLTCALRAVHAGACWMDPLIARRLIDLNCSMHRGIKDGAASVKEILPEPIVEELISLSQRECQVLDLIVKGWGNKEIATELGLSRDTVKTHVRHILEKFCVKTRTEAAVRAMRTGLFKSGTSGIRAVV